MTGAYFAARDTSTFALHTIQVSGGTPALQARVRAVLAPLVGRSLMGLNGHVVERNVDALPDVVSARYDRAFPHTLRVSVVAEKPVAVVRRGRGTWLVSARARVLALIPRGSEPTLPRIWVPRRTSFQIGGFLAPTAGGLAARTAALATRFPARIATVALGHGELVFRLRSGVVLRLGAPVDVRLKLAIARRALVQLPAGATYVDVSVPGRPVAGADPQLSGGA